MGFFDALSSPMSYWEKIRDEASRIVYSRLRGLRMGLLGLPAEVMALHGNNRKVEDDLRSGLVVYYSSCIIFLDRFMLQPRNNSFQDYERRIKCLGAQSVIDLASACHMHYVFAYDDFDDPDRSSAGFLMRGAAFAYGKTGHYMEVWASTRFHNQDPVACLNERLCDEFADALGVNRFNALEMVNLCSMADAINGYVANLCANPGNLLGLAETLMEIPFRR